MTRTFQKTGLLGVALIAAAAIPTLAQMNQGHQGHDHAPPGAPGAGNADVAEHARMFTDVNRAVALLIPTEGNEAAGRVVFEQTKDDKVRVTYQISGLEPGSTHGFHVHQYGDLSAPDGTSLGGHYDPDGHPHNLPDKQPRHAGDLGNITANDQGVAEGTLTVDTMTIAGLKNPIIGRGVVVHAQRDTGQGESGEAGARIGVGVIGVGQPADSN